jgi:formylmethanofuran dehydrogenase subunit C
MTGGTILVDGDAGNEIGLTMRRGMIAIGGSAGDVLGFNMIAGTVLVFGECGIRVGAGMRRGTLGLLGPNPPTMLPSFKYDCTYQPQFVRLMLCELLRRGFHIDAALLDTSYDLYRGDLVSLGKGEVLMRHAA